MEVFDAENSVDWDLFFRTQIAQHGNGYFYGSPFQRGWGPKGQTGHGLGNIFRSLFRFLVPVAKKAVKVVGKQALRSGIDVAGDVVDGQSIKQSLKSRGREGLQNLVKKARGEISGQEGKGLGSRQRKVKKRKAQRPVKIGVVKKKRRTTLF